MKKRTINILRKLSPFYEKPFSMYGYAEFSENGDNYKWVSEKELKAKNDKIERRFSIARWIIWSMLIGTLVSILFEKLLQ